MSNDRETISCEAIGLLLRVTDDAPFACYGAKTDGIGLIEDSIYLLRRKGLIEKVNKLDDGTYRITSGGFEFARAILATLKGWNE